MYLKLLDMELVLTACIAFIIQSGIASANRPKRLGAKKCQSPPIPAGTMHDHTLHGSPRLSGAGTFGT